MGVMHGAIALVKVNGIVVGKMRNIRVQENVRRVEVVGLGNIFASEAPVTGWAGTLSCSSMAIDLKTDGIPNALRRNFINVASQVLVGQESLEDQLVLDPFGVQVDIFKKVTDIIDPATGIIKPKIEPFCIVYNCLIEGETLDVSEGQIAGKDQTFKYLQAYTTT